MRNPPFRPAGGATAKQQQHPPLKTKARTPEQRPLQKVGPNDNLWSLLRAKLDDLHPIEQAFEEEPEPEPWQAYRVDRMDDLLAGRVQNSEQSKIKPATIASEEHVQRALAHQANLQALVEQAEAEAEVCHMCIAKT
jgi:hypothetical protein